MADLRDNYERALRKFEVAETNLKKYDVLEIFNHKTSLSLFEGFEIDRIVLLCRIMTNAVVN